MIRKLHMKTALKRYRWANEMTQQEFAHKFGCSIRTLARWESGTVKPSKIWHMKLKRRGVCQ